MLCNTMRQSSLQMSCGADLWRLHHASVALLLDPAEPGRDGERAVAVAELDRLGVADREGLVEQPLRDRVGQRVLLALVPQPGGHVAALAERVREREPAELQAARGDGGAVGRPQRDELAPLVDRRVRRVIVAAL